MINLRGSEKVYISAAVIKGRGLNMPVVHSKWIKTHLCGTQSLHVMNEISLLLCSIAN